MTTTALEVDVSAVGAVGKDTDSASAPMQCGGGLLTLDTNSNNNSVRVNLSISLCEFSNGSGVKHWISCNGQTRCHPQSPNNLPCKLLVV
jgi:hypothetical protein